MPTQIQDAGALNAQIREIVGSAIDRRQFVDVVSEPNVDTEFAVAHGLGRVPVGYIPIGQDKAAGFYKGGTPWTAQYIYLACTVSSVSVRLLVF